MFAFMEVLCWMSLGLQMSGDGAEHSRHVETIGVHRPHEAPTGTFDCR